MEEERIELEGIIVDIDHTAVDGRSAIRITLKQDGKIYSLYDTEFRPYFYIAPNVGVTEEMLERSGVPLEGEMIKPHKVYGQDIRVGPKQIRALVVEVNNTRHVPKLSESLGEFGKRYEYDILFWKRYLIDKGISPLTGAKVKARMENNRLIVENISGTECKGESLSYICFDIETYNPLGAPRPDKDPAIMISYYDGEEARVLTTKEINREFVVRFDTEKEMIEAFISVIKKKDFDLIVGYNSSNFDIPYLMTRAAKNHMKFDIDRYGEGAKTEHHGLIEAAKIPGRANVDIYNVAKFVAVVGASDKLIRANRFTLSEVYAAITGDTKRMVDRRNIWQLWDGSAEDREGLADYSLADSKALHAVYKFFIDLEMEVARVTGTTLGEACISTTGQLVEFLLMRYAHDNKEIVPNKPSEGEITRRLANPIEGAYVKEPEAGIYKDIAVFDFRGLYPSIIIAYNIDNSTICADGREEFHEAPTKTRFVKAPIGIIPSALKLLTSERLGIKRAAKKDPENKALAARSQALKIIANSFYGYLGYARSRWYSRECAASVTAFGREYIAKTMELAENSGFKVLYGDTDSIFLLMKEKSKDDALSFLKNVNTTLPESMELELEDFYVSGVFVGKKGGSAGAKKKYALLSETGRIKIRGFELVRRDWSSISRETQRMVLETILKDGSKEKAVLIVKDVIRRLRGGEVNLGELVIRTQLRKRIDSYDSKSPELAAAKKAIKEGVRKKEDLEGSTIGYVVTKRGNSISEKAELEDIAKDYDPDYYINHQIIPATLKILKELGVSEDELKGMGAQKKL